MSAQIQTKRIQERKPIINVNTNAQIKQYQKQLVLLSFSKGDVSTEYFRVLKKIKILRKGALSGRLQRR